MKSETLEIRQHLKGHTHVLYTLDIGFMLKDARLKEQGHVGFSVRLKGHSDQSYDTEYSLLVATPHCNAPLQPSIAGTSESSKIPSPSDDGSRK